MRAIPLATAAVAAFAICAAPALAQHMCFRADFDRSPDAIVPGRLVKAETSGKLQWAVGHKGMAWRNRPGVTCTYPTAGVLDSDAGSIEFWVQPAWPSNDGKTHYLLADDRRAIKVCKHANGRVYLQFPIRRPKHTALSAGGAVQWKLGQWHHVVVAWTGAASETTDFVGVVCIDGETIAWHRAKGRRSPLGKRFWIGSDAKGVNAFDGAIDSVRIYSAPTVSLDQPKSARAVGGVPTDDPDLPTTAYIPPGIEPDPLHRLDTVQATQWAGFPPELAKECFADSAAQRVIYRDTLTGAEVWIMLRTPADEGVAYTNYFPFNANGSLIRVWGRGGLCMKSDGARVRQFKTLIPHEFAGLPRWHKTDPDVLICTTANGGRFEFNLRTGKRRDLFIPDPSIPPRTDIQFSDDAQHSLFISRQGTKRPLWCWLGDGKGKSRREVKLKSASPKPDLDRMGSAAFIRDQHDKLYMRYSLNKGFPRTGPTPYQNWLVELDGSSFRRMDSHNNLLDGSPLHFRPSGTFIVTGHGGYSPSMKYFVHHKGHSGYKWIRNLATWKQRDIAHIPGCDHMDWTIDDNWFFVWANQIGLPIYQCFIDTGVVHRIVATNSCPHTYGTCPYHGSSPDGTKLLFKSAMLGNLDLYMAIVRYPAPPTGVKLRRDGRAATLEWTRPKRGKEVAGFNVYRSDRSGRGFARINDARVAGTTFTDPAPPAKAYYALTSVEYSGIEGRVFSQEAALAAGPISRYLEAEAAALEYPMRAIFRPLDSSDNFAITRAVRTGLWDIAQGTGRATWSVDLPSNGAYALWARMKRSGSKPAPAAWAIDGKDLAAPTPDKTEWQWLKLAALDLSAGPHKLVAAMDKPGVEVDKLLLTSDAGFTPAGMGDAPTQRPETVAALEAEVDKHSGMVVLHWDACASPMFHHYQLYRGAAADFAPDQSRLFGSPTRPAFIDPGPLPQGDLFYRVVAVDAWGNESKPSAATQVQMPPRPEPVSVVVQAETGALAGGARVLEDKDAQGGRCVAFGQPDSPKPPEYAGKLTVPVDLPPGRYSVWLRVKGAKRKSTGFFWAGLGDTKHYSRMKVVLWGMFTNKQDWLWRRVTFLNSVKNPQEAAMRYNVTKRPTQLTIRHRANYMAVDCALITSDPCASPVPGNTFHPGCSKAFKRKAR